MRPSLLVSLFALVSASSLCAQGYPANGCFANRKENPPFKKKLWAGYEVSLGAARNGEAEEKCTAAIYRVDGKVVYRTTGYSVVFDDEHTGLDFDGDGQPEVVFKTDTGGGMHCCWAYNIISLTPKPQHLFDIDQQGLVQFEKDKNGKLMIWKRTAGPYGFTSMAATPFAEKVLQVREGKLTDITPEYCRELFTEKNEEFRFWQEKLTAANLKRLQESQAPGGEETEEVVNALLSKALQHVFCRQFDEALKDLDLWPEASRAKMKKDFGASIKNDYPEFAARLEAGK